MEKRMEENQFSQIMQEEAKKMGVELDAKQIRQFYLYMMLLLEWNEKMNLTAITEPKEIVVKHFMDSLTIYPYLEKGKKIIDVGTGAGFPGVPYAILDSSASILLADSLQKRTIFLEAVKKELGLENVSILHGRAEDLGKDSNYREQFDFAVSRAVAPLPILLEYLIPFVKKDGYCICMKGSNGKAELKESKNALKVLGAEVIEEKEFLLLDTDMGRTIFKIHKEKSTPKEYPRKAGVPTKQPL